MRASTAAPERLSAQKAAELKKAESDNPGYEDYMAGQRCYERGQYPQAEQLLTSALDKSGTRHSPAVDRALTQN